MDAVIDFPPQALLCRVGLLQAMLDVLGNPTACSVEVFHSSPFGLHPLFAMNWFKQLLIASKTAFKTQMEGSMCSTIPRSFASGKNEDGMYTTAGMTETSERVVPGGLAAELVSNNTL